MPAYRKCCNLTLWISMVFFPILTVAQSTLTDEEDSLAIEWLRGISRSEGADLLTRSLVSQHYFPDTPQAFVLEADATPPEMKVALSILIDQCSKYPNIEYCENSTLEEQLIEVDPDNLVPYLYLFSHYVRKSQNDAALQALIRALSTTGNNDYYYEKVMHLRNQLHTVGIEDGRKNLVAEIYSLNSLLSIYTSINPVCVQESANSEMWKSVCLDLSSSLEQGMTLFSNIYGASIRRDIFSALSPASEEAIAAQSRRDFYDQFRIEARTLLDWWDDLERRPDSFYIEASQFGELQADQLAMDRSRIENR